MPNALPNAMPTTTLPSFHRSPDRPRKPRPHQTPTADRGLARCDRIVVAMATAVVLLVMLATPAASHAVMVSSTPADREQLATAPSSVTFTFNEAVTTGLGGITVLNRDARRMDLGATAQPSPTQVRADLTADMGPGTYLASYRVVSGDGHVITGATVFAVGEAIDAASVANLSPDTDPAVRALTTIANVLLYAGALVAIGLSLFSLLVHDGGRDRKRLVPWVQWSALVALVGAIGHVIARAGEGTGRGLGSVTESGVLTEVLRQGGTGWWLVGLLMGLAVMVASVGLAAGSVRQVLVAYGAFIAAGSFALTGHTTQAQPAVVAGLANAIHMLVAAVWLGGLVGLALVLRWRSSDNSGPVGDTTGPASSARLVVRFSTVAAAAVAGLWVTGVIQAWFTVGSLNGLVDSDYGMILLVKLVVVVATMAMAAWNRWKLLPALADPVDSPVDGPVIAPATVVTRVGRTVRLEVVALLVVVLITSVLVETPPATTAVMEAQPFNQTLPLTEGVDLNVLVTPGAVGLNEIHITYIDNQGLLDDRVESVVVEMNLPAEGIGPIPANGATLGPGHYLVTTENLAVAGVWRLDIVSRVGLFDQLRTTFEVPIR